jgi:tryptophanyl-tRNA synthetase
MTPAAAGDSAPTVPATAPVVVSGARPTGQLHLGNLHGAIRVWLNLQQSEYRCFFFVADWHALTTDYADPTGLLRGVEDMVRDWLAIGLDPRRVVIFRQSLILEHAELHLLFSMITPVPWLERNPVYKEQREQMADRDLSTLGFLGYPVLQAADILMYKGTRVPVGIDQVPHVELTREIARRFNQFYGAVFPEPEALLADTPKIPGLDGRKMSKSYNNAVLLTDPSRRDRPQAVSHDDRPAAGPANRSRGPEGLPGLRSPPGLLFRRRDRLRDQGVPERQHRLSGVQEDHDQARARRLGADPRTALSPHGGGGTRCPARRNADRQNGGAVDDARRTSRDRPGWVTGR